jgi:hypothetical protein
MMNEDVQLQFFDLLFQEYPKKEFLVQSYLIMNFSLERLLIFFDHLHDLHVQNINVDL